MGVIITKTILMFSCEDEQKNGANISSWDNWVDGTLGIKGAAMGPWGCEFRCEHVAFEVPEGGDV